MNTKVGFAGIPDSVRAAWFAEIAHAGQVYNKEVPYTVHLDCVVEVLGRFGERSEEMKTAAWLHDTIEDTGTSYNDIKDRFGVDVAETVYAVTNELGRNRKERHAKTAPKIKNNNKASLLKLADRIANVEYGAATGGKRDMYIKEFPEFFAALYVPHTITHVTMWHHLAVLLEGDVSIRSQIDKDMVF